MDRIKLGGIRQWPTGEDLPADQVGAHPSPQGRSGLAGSRRHRDALLQDFRESIVNVLRIAWTRVRASVQTRTLDRELEQEITSHLEEATEDNLKRGLSLGDARREARLSFGSVSATREAHRDIRGLPFAERLMQ